MNKILRTLSLGLVATGITVGATSGAAHALPFMSATTAITANGVLCCHDVAVTVNGVATMPQADAQRFIDFPGNEATAAIWGQDGDFFHGGDDKLVGATPVTTYSAASDGLHFTKTWIVDRTVLNEDIDGQDEVYVKVSLLDIRTGLTSSVKSNVVKRSF